MTMPPMLPPQPRSAATLALVAPAAAGRFALQCCKACGNFIYPVRNICPTCLSQDIAVTDAPAGGLLLSETTIRITGDPFFRERPPVRQGLVRADCGVTIIAILHRDCPPEGRVRLSLRLDRGGKPLLLAFPLHPESSEVADDPSLRDLTMDPAAAAAHLADPDRP